jgi:hypothetical protein
MSIRKTIAVMGALALATFGFTATQASAHSTREVLATFGSFGEPGGIAVDLETGNVYVTDTTDNTVDVFGATGGPPVGGVPSQITGLQFTPGEPAGLAVDNSCYEHEPRLTGMACEEYDPSYGDLYIVYTNLFPDHYKIVKFKLNPGHGYEPAGEINEEELQESAEGIAIDSHGDIYVAHTSVYESYHVVKETFPPVMEFKKVVEKITNDGEEELKERLEKINIPQTLVIHPAFVAVDGDGADVYISDEHSTGSRAGEEVIAKLQINDSGGVLSESVLAHAIVGAKLPLAVDQASGVVFVAAGSTSVSSEIDEYSAGGALQLAFGSAEPLGGSLGKGVTGVNAIVVNSVTGLIYVANPLHEDVDVFGPVVDLPVVGGVQPAASAVSRTSALIAGTATPESVQSADYYFEYVDAAEYEPGAAEPYREGGRTAISALPGSHAAEETDRVALTGLRPGTTYHYRLVVTNASGTAYGPDETFTTAPATPPVAGTGPAGEVTATSATLTGMVAPHGLPTSYVFEVGTDTSYGGARLFGSAGSGTGEVSVAVALAYLVPDTTYHYRLVASSFDGTSYGQDGTFTTPGVPSSIGQPAATALIASPSVQFPSIAGAIDEPVKATPRKALTSAQKRAAALRVCRKRPAGKQRRSCEARARKVKRATKTNKRKTR